MGAAKRSPGGGGGSGGGGWRAASMGRTSSGPIGGPSTPLHASFSSPYPTMWGWLRRRGNTDTVKLLMLGYRQELCREFTLFNSFGSNLNVLSSFTALAGTYGIGVGFTYGGPVVMTWGWLVVLLLTFSVGLSLAELASAYPTSGALYYWSYRLAPPRFRSLVCFMTAWIITLGQAAISASAVFTFVQLMEAAVEHEYGVDVSPLQRLGVLAATLAALLVLNCGSARMIAFITTLGAFWHLFALVGFCVALLLLAPRRQPAEYIFTSWEPNSSITGVTSPTYTVLLGIMMAQWGFTGIDGAAHIAEETLGAEVTVPVAMLLSIAGAGACGLLLMVSLMAVKVDPAIVFDPSGGSNMALQILAQFMDVSPSSSRVHGSLSSSVALFSIAVVGAFFCSFQAVANNSRMLYAFARDGGVPFSRLAARVHPATRAPVGAAVYMLAACAALSVPMCFNAAVFPIVTSFAILAVCAAYLVPVLCKLTTGRRLFLAGPFQLRPWLSTANNVLTAVWVGLVLVLFTLPSVYPVTPANCNWSGPMLLGLVALLLAWYHFPGYGAKFWFRGPRPNLGQFHDVLPSDVARAAEAAAAAAAAAAEQQQQQQRLHGAPEPQCQAAGAAAASEAPAWRKEEKGLGGVVEDDQGGRRDADADVAGSGDQGSARPRSSRGSGGSRGLSGGVSAPAAAATAAVAGEGRCSRQRSSGGLAGVRKPLALFSGPNTGSVQEFIPAGDGHATTTTSSAYVTAGAVGCDGGGVRGAVWPAIAALGEEYPRMGLAAEGNGDGGGAGAPSAGHCGPAAAAAAGGPLFPRSSAPQGLQVSVAVPLAALAATGRRDSSGHLRTSAECYVGEFVGGSGGGGGSESVGGGRRSSAAGGGGRSSFLYKLLHSGTGDAAAATQPTAAAAPLAPLPLGAGVAAGAAAVGGGGASWLYDGVSAPYDDRRLHPPPECSSCVDCGSGRGDVGSGDVGGGGGRRARRLSGSTHGRSTATSGLRQSKPLRNSLVLAPPPSSTALASPGGVTTSPLLVLSHQLRRRTAADAATGGGGAAGGGGGDYASGGLCCPLATAADVRLLTAERRTGSTAGAVAMGSYGHQYGSTEECGSPRRSSAAAGAAMAARWLGGFEGVVALMAPPAGAGTAAGGAVAVGGGRERGGGISSSAPSLQQRQQRQQLAAANASMASSQGGGGGHSPVSEEPSSEPVSFRLLSTRGW